MISARPGISGWVKRGAWRMKSFSSRQAHACREVSVAGCILGRRFTVSKLRRSEVALSSNDSRSLRLHSSLGLDALDIGRHRDTGGPRANSPLEGILR